MRDEQTEFEKKAFLEILPQEIREKLETIGDFDNLMK
jgi:hypothetical protein